MTIRAIETRYKGYRFRSRLEARWAVFFDAMGWKWEYEREGFEIYGMLYLPDFYLTDAKVFVEVKAVWPTEDDMLKVLALADYHPVVLAVGLPEPVSYLICHGPDDQNAGLLEWHDGEVGNFEMTYDAIGTNHSDYLGREYMRAVNSARAARFEHGENG